MTSSDGECGAVSCATVALVCAYVRCVCWFAAAAIADISTDSRYQLGHWSLRVRLGGEMQTALLEPLNTTVPICSAQSGNETTVFPLNYRTAKNNSKRECQEIFREQ